MAGSTRGARGGIDRVLARLDRSSAWTTVSTVPTLELLAAAPHGTIYSVTTASHLYLYIKMDADRWVTARGESLAGAITAWIERGPRQPARYACGDARVRAGLSRRGWLRRAKLRADQR